MNFAVSVEDLRRSVRLASRAIALTKKVLQATPILGNLLIEANNYGVVSVVGTDLTTAAKVEISASRCENAGAVTVPARILLDTLTPLSGDTIITVSSTSDGSMLVTHGACVVRIPGSPAEEFPVIPRPGWKISQDSRPQGEPPLSPLPVAWEENPDHSYLGEIPADAFLTLIARGGYAITSEPSRFSIDGAMLEFRQSVVRMVSTDGHRLAIADYSQQNSTQTVRSTLVPYMLLDLASKAWAKCKSNLHVSVDDQNVFIAGPSVTLVARKLAMSFPDYMRILPTCRYAATADKSLFVGALRRAKPFTDKENRCVFMKFRSDVCEVTVVKKRYDNTEELKYSEVIPIDWDGPINLSAGWNVDYLLDWADRLKEANTVSMCIEDNAWNDTYALARAAMCVADTPGVGYLVMPMRV